MTGDRNGLLDELIVKNERLYRAQTILLDCYAFLDDTVIEGRMDDVNSMLTLIHNFLETVPWEQGPDDKDVQAVISTGFAPELA